MRQFLKTTFTVFVALVFTAGMAFGQNNADVEQDGDNSQATIEQNLRGHEGGLDADIAQTGNDHEATIRQVSSNASDADKAVADIIQAEGNENYALIDQNRRRGAEAKLSQLGSSNRATVYQGPGDVLGGYDGGRALQEGSNNELEVVQTRNPDNLDENTGNSFEKVGATQIGDDNFGQILQYGRDGTGVFGNEASLLQDGADNHAVLEQTGNSNVVDVMQTGHGNVAHSDQFGAGNTSTITQQN